MKTVKIIFGSYGAYDAKRCVKVIECGETCEVDDAEADRLVALGVAAVVAAAPQAAADEDEACGDTAATETPSEGDDAPLDAEQLSAMTNAKLEQMAKELGLDTSKCKKKADYVELIISAEAADEDEEEDEDIEEEDEEPVDDGEAPPDLSAEAPVV